MARVLVRAVCLAREGGEVAEMVASLGWLALEQEQAGHLLEQANCVVRLLLGRGEQERAREGAAMVPGGVLEQAGREWRGEGGSLPGSAVREHLALHTYLSAMEAFNDWFDHFHQGKPGRPVLQEGASFTEKVAHEQKEKVYQGELERWRGGQQVGSSSVSLLHLSLSQVQSRQAEDRLRALLTFPGGWLLEQEEEEGEDTMDTREQEEEARSQELASLRRQLLPRSVLLLHSLLHSTGQHSKAVQLADLVAEEGHQLYQAFNQVGAGGWAFESYKLLHMSGSLAISPYS